MDGQSAEGIEEGWVGFNYDVDDIKSTVTVNKGQAFNCEL